MLAPQEFSPGSLADASPLSLVLPRNKRESHFLVGLVDDAPFAVFLSDQWRFRGFSCSESSHYGGIIIPNIAIEMDPASSFMSDGFHAPAGSLVRKGTGLYLSFLHERGLSRGSPLMCLVDDLPEAKEEAGFLRWAISIGVGPSKRTLHSVSIEASE